ncbi:hypothetical protein FC62_GL001220 [Amylolactobacillus amylotrophicus DSM 20534]|uniref:Uncharacterized protein n=3 Tax=Amylolactobacillus TaxID=2767876 RepID=A0A1L6XC60_9LACO|nr:MULTISPECIES: hypothetical protein [Amylolactobacillus]APT18541.1 hypothetical protein LA20533_04355 [Amylolactobacillus amylophilus DSM 20533 = JCM 1125]KRK37607.1 hypothetical protein FC62_GL001220 [Amylolactobacillus amylotrophicus DSM 20534]KRM43582.1 hypothetical protein FD40_GL001525 [Amylolactobacillus amylophilus DSM 20533 = JCM 1125]GED80325.1 hypothetical protein LAM01_07980 [Amylolactobacillus amylophilus]
MSEQSEKIRRFILTAGFLGVLPTAVQFQLYRQTGLIFYLILSLISLVLALLFLLQSRDTSWQNRSKVVRYIVLAIFFMGIVPAIPLLLTLKYTTKEQ